MSEFRFGGLNLALATPFDENGKVDYGRLEENIDKYIDAGIRSFLLSSGTGVHVYLSRDEAAELVTRGARLINGRATVIAQTSALLADEVVDRTKHAADNGVDGVMVLPPFFEGPAGDDELFSFYESVGAGGLPIIGYNVPGGVAPAISPELFHRLIEIPNFVSVKDSRGDLSLQADLIRTGLPVLNGADSLAAVALYSGAAGVIWGGANIAPETAGAFVDAAMDRQWDKARELWRPLEPLMRHLEQSAYVPSVYAAAELTGYPAGSPRRPFAALPDDQRAELKPFIDALPTPA